MIWDAFLYRDEPECLEIRLHELAPVVDRFILVEGGLTFQNGEKGWNYPEVADRFVDFPIDYFQIASPKFVNPWESEAFHRNQILKGLELGEAGADDTVLISDADEIPSAEAVLRAEKLLKEQPPDTLAQIGFQQELSFYFVNCRNRYDKWSGTQAVRCETAYLQSPEGIRRQRHSSTQLPNGGWHFCNLGDPEWLVEKLQSFAHTEIPESYQDPELLARCIAERREMTGRTDLDFEMFWTDQIRLPSYLQEHRNGKFAHLFGEVEPRERSDWPMPAWGRAGT